MGGVLVIALLLGAALPAIELLRQAFRPAPPIIQTAPPLWSWLFWRVLQASIVIAVFMFDAHSTKPIGGYAPLIVGASLAFYATFALPFYQRLLARVVVLIHGYFQRPGLG